MSPQHCSLAYADDVESETELFHHHVDQHKPALTLRRRSNAEMTAMDDIVEFGGTITISF